MSEDHQIVSRARGEPLPEGSTGLLVGHAAVGHLRLNVSDIVQADQIVLEGVEKREAPALGDALERAIDAANRASTDAPNPPPNMAQKEADGIARTIEVHQP
jgi:hypothetical protein